MDGDKQFSGDMFYDFLRHKSCVDVTLSAGGQSMEAHKLILACCSSWFQKLFEYTAEKHPIIHFKDITFSRLQQIVRFIYTATVEIAQEDVEDFQTCLVALGIVFISPAENEDHQEEVIENEKKVDVDADHGQQTPEPVAEAIKSWGKNYSSSVYDSTLEDNDLGRDKSSNPNSTDFIAKRCPICPTVFVSEPYVRKHMLEHHGHGYNFEV